MKNLTYIFLFGIILLIGIVEAEANPCGNDNSFLKGKQGDNITLKQTCDSCTYVNLSSITYPNSTMVVYNSRMIKDGIEFKISFANTNTLGCYSYVVFGDKDGTLTSETIDLKVTETGEDVDSSQTIGVIAMIGVMFLFFGLARAFNNEKWKLKLTFDILAIIMALISINSIRIIAVQSENLATMSKMGLIVIISILAFMIFYFLIMMTIEVINYFKKKEAMKWETSNTAY